MSLYTSLQERLNGHIYNGYFACLCPFHDDHSPSFFVREDGSWYCKSNSCHSHGKTLEQLERKLGGHDVKVQKGKSQVLPRWREWENKYGDLEGIADFAHRHAEHWYFKERKIDEFFELGYFGSLDNWVLFPVFDIKHKIQNIVVRHTKKKDVRYAIKHTEENKPLLYCPNWRRVQESDTIFIPFGIIDSWAFEACNLASVTGITGKSLSAELLAPLNREIVFIPDYGEEKEAHQLANRLGWKAHVKRLKYEDNEKDPDQVRRFHGNEYLLSLIGATI